MPVPLYDAEPAALSVMRIETAKPPVWRPDVDVTLVNERRVRVESELRRWTRTRPRGNREAGASAHQPKPHRAQVRPSRRTRTTPTSSIPSDPVAPPSPVPQHRSRTVVQQAFAPYSSSTSAIQTHGAASSISASSSSLTRATWAASTRRIAFISATSIASASSSAAIALRMAMRSSSCWSRSLR